jgi:hypothetical protein
VRLDAEPRVLERHVQLVFQLCKCHAPCVRCVRCVRCVLLATFVSFEA